MALVIGDNFSFQGAKPLDGRLKYDTLANMKAVGDSTMYDGCLAYCVATDKTYQWKSTNTVDADLGKWREFSSGGGGGHVIEDSEGTALTQRETMQFGDGFNATDDSENEKTVVEPNLMTAADMDDVVTPLPSVGNKMPVLFDESGAERVVGWYKYANGTKQHMYERQLKLVLGTIQADTWKSLYDLANIPNIDLNNPVKIEILAYDIYGRNLWITNSMWTTNSPVGSVPATPRMFTICVNQEFNQIRLISTYTVPQSEIDGNNYIYIAIQYTKTTDTPNT